MSTYPEHEKLKALGDKKEIVADFIDWLYENGWSIACRHEHVESCGAFDTRVGRYNCGYLKNEFERDLRNPESLMADFFEIDLNKLSDEKDQMVRELQSRSL